MNSQVLRNILGRLGKSQIEAAEILRVDERTMRRWILDERPVPCATAALLRLWVHGDIDETRLRRAIADYD